MKNYRLRTAAFVAFLTSPAFLAAGQTGRIAHFSHGGSVAKLATEQEAKDNFGVSYVENEWKEDSIVMVSATRVEHRGQRRMRLVSTKQGAGPWKREVDSYPMADKQMLEMLFPDAVAVGFLKEKKPVKKPARHSQVLPKRPFQYSCWPQLAGVTALGAVGWLLGRRPKTV